MLIVGGQELIDDCQEIGLLGGPVDVSACAAAPFEVVEDLAGDIARNGLLQAPVGRVVSGEGRPAAPSSVIQNETFSAPKGTEAYRVQLAFGHNRLRAYRHLAGQDKRFSTMPVVIRLLGEDLRDRLPRFRPDRSVVMHALRLDEAIDAALGWLADPEDDHPQVCRWVCKQLVRAGLEIVIEEEGRYTRDLWPCFEVFERHFPERARVRESGGRLRRRQRHLRHGSRRPVLGPAGGLPGRPELAGGVLRSPDRHSRHGTRRS